MITTKDSLIRPRMEYYAWRHLPFWQFQGLNTLTALFDTLTRIPSDVTEPHVARQKLAFFHDDIVRAQNGAAHHPAAQALAALLKTDPLNITAFDDLCTAIETEIDRVQSIDDNDLNRYCKRKRGAFLVLCGELLKKSPLSNAEITQLENLGIFIERICLLQKKASLHEKMHLFSLKDFSLPEYIAQTRRYFTHTNATDALYPIFLLARLYNALLTLLEKSLPTEPDAFITLTPMHLLILSIFYRMKGF